jgi:hypothetical protein
MHATIRRLVAGVAAGAAVALSVTVAQPAASAQPAGTPSPGPDRASVAPPDRARTLGPGWQTSSDRAVTTDGDSTGLHVLVADARDGYAWRTAATLTEPGTTADQWIGQSCVTGSGQRAVVVYAPRQLVNKETGFRQGGLVAVVDLATGAVQKLPIHASLAYYNPGCGADETAAITENFTRAGKYISRVTTVDAGAGTTGRPVDVLGQVTSAVSAGGGIVASKGSHLVSVATDGTTKELARTDGTPFRLSVDRQGGVGYEVQTGGQTEVRRFAAGHDSMILSAGTRSVQLHQIAGSVFVQGGSPGRAPATGPLPASWRSVGVEPSAQLATDGRLAVTNATNENSTAGVGAVTPGRPRPVSISTTVLATGARPAFVVLPHPLRPADGAAASPGLPGSAGTTRPRPQAAPDPSTVTTDPNRGCAIPRNDPTIQSKQPTPQMAEWAADLAVQGQLTVPRPVGWNGSALPAYTPQGMFPSHPLIGGGQVPAQILLGVMAQESNEWQAGQDTVDGESGNFEQGGFYGNNGSLDHVDFQLVDCGYGATQVTTGMAVAAGQAVYTPTQQLAITVDYAANIAAGLQVLQDKWNQLKQLNVVPSNADPAKIENWWFALWAYNSGWHAAGSDASGMYGLGWTNNMANEDYPPDRAGFLDNGYADAKTPNHWSYPERVLGWAVHALLRLDWIAGVYGPAYRTATWAAGASPTRPPLGTFCTVDNQCDMSQIHHPTGYPADKGSHCLRDDLQCWWHQSVTWVNCQSSCGTEALAYRPGSPEPSSGAATLYKPDCNAAGELPSNALVVDDVAAPVHTETTCTKTWSNSGMMSWKFAADSVGSYPSKIDFHQLDTGFGGHLWTAHAWRSPSSGFPANAIHGITGTWTLNQQLNGWARVLVYLPDHGAMSPQATYDIHGTDSSSPTRTLVEGNYLDDTRKPAPGRWESLGAFHFTGTPSVSLSNFVNTPVGTWPEGERDVAWDAIAFQPLPGKPANQMVALGDSYASGEGASNNPVNGAYDYYRASDHDGGSVAGDDSRFRDACHRSPYSWSRVSRLPDNPGATIGGRADSYDPALDYHMSACSGARTDNMVGGVGQYGEGTQLSQGYLDQNTTLVTLSVGGNDARFSDIFQQCVYKAIGLCQNSTLAGDTAPLNTAEPALLENTVRPNIENVLKQIHAKAPTAKILLMGYPRLLEGVGGCIPGIGVDEAPWLNSMADLLDSKISAAATAVQSSGVPVTYVDPRNAFSGKAACGQPVENVHGLVLSLTRSDDPIVQLWPGIGVTSNQSLHPKVDGAALYGTLATATFAAMGA